MPKPSASSFLPSVHWWAILLSLGVSTAGWGAKFCAVERADVLIAAGTGLLVISAMLTLRRLARQVGLPIVCPLCLLGVGILLLVLDTAWPGLALSASQLLRLLGEITAAAGVVRLLISLNAMLSPKPMLPKQLLAARFK